MNIATSAATMAQRKDSFETIAQIKSSITAGANKKRLRHSLKDLCFHVPSESLVSPLLLAFKSELKDQSQCFKLLAFHLINHAKMTKGAAECPQVISAIIPIVTDFKKSTKYMHLIFRVLFYLCCSNQENMEQLLTVVSKIITMDLSEAFKKKKKSLVGGKVLNTLPELIDECVSLLVELPDFANSARTLLSDEKFVSSICGIFEAMTDKTRRNILLFLGKAGTTLPQFQDLLKSCAHLKESPAAAQFLVNNRDSLSSDIDAILDKPVSNTDLVQRKLIEVEGASERVEKSLASINESSVITLFNLLKKKPIIELPDEQIQCLHSLAEDSNTITSVYAFLCLALITREPHYVDWVSDFYSNLMKELTYTKKCAVSQIFLDTWREAIQFQEVREVFWALLDKLLAKFGDTISPDDFTPLITKLIEIGESDRLIMSVARVLQRRPSTESVMMIFYAAGLAKGSADPAVLRGFNTIAFGYVETAGPAVSSFYDMTMHSE